MTDIKDLTKQDVLDLINKHLAGNELELRELFDDLALIHDYIQYNIEDDRR